MNIHDNFWTSNIHALIENNPLKPFHHKSIYEQLNCISQFAIIISCCLIFFNLELAIFFLLSSLLFIIIIYFIIKRDMNKNNKKNKKKKKKTPGFILSGIGSILL